MKKHGRGTTGRDKVRLLFFPKKLDKSSISESTCGFQEVGFLSVNTISQRPQTQRSL